jgi:hypothetical protein
MKTQEGAYYVLLLVLWAKLVGETYSLKTEREHGLNLGHERQSRGHGHSAGYRESANVENTDREDNFVLGRDFFQWGNHPRTTGVTGQPTASTDFTDQQIALPPFESSAKPNLRHRKVEERPSTGVNRIEGKF